MLPNEFLEKVDQHGPLPEHRPDLGPCWLWTNKPNRDGYGRFFFQRERWLAHRYAYAKTKGAIDGQIDHLCRVRRCVNPKHLEAVTSAENTARGSTATKTHCASGHPFNETNTLDGNQRKGRHRHRRCRTCNRERARKLRALRPARGPKISEEAIAMMRLLDREGVKQSDIAERTGVSRAQVCRILNGKSRSR